MHGDTAVGILHLTALNPHIIDTMEQQLPGGPELWMPRATGAAPGSSDSSGQGVAGISGFAFQGTNAHVLLGRCA